MVQLASFLAVLAGLASTLVLASPLEIRQDAPQSTLNFTQDLWPSEFKGGQSFDVTWEGGSPDGLISLSWISIYGGNLSDGGNISVSQVLENVTADVTSKEVFFAPRKCWDAEDMFFAFRISEIVDGAENRDWGDQVRFVPGSPEDEAKGCEQTDGP
ncbi:hypothetical protein IAU59_007471 [Kwoniella sp. CBS 9459]